MIDDDRPPLGATLTDDGALFCVHSRNATGVELCLFDHEESVEHTRIPMERGADFTYVARVASVRAGQLYGFRVHGPFDPARGHRFDPSKVIVDPYARAIANDPLWSRELYSYDVLAEDLERAPARHDDGARASAKSVVVDGQFDWGDDAPIRRPWKDTIIYECHVKGMTARHPELPEDLRGTYAGLAHPALIEHFKSLGVTAIELLPIHEIGDERHLVARGARNYWGYATLGFFAPSGRYSASGRRGEQVEECKAMIRSLHRAGIEVLLDVVYNHTCEGNHLGPTLSLRGLDNASYYRLREGDLAKYDDVTGTGNSLDLDQPAALRLVLDSLRYWVTEFHVDGFRFDLAAALSRGKKKSFEHPSALWSAVVNDPILSRVKLIAEPWDIGVGGYRLAQFPHPMREWNGAFRDTARRYWLQRAAGTRGVFASRVAGSSDLYGASARPPTASVNFITSHDGFTLSDLVSYLRKHNEANGESNRDGSDNEHSDNHGFEGATDDVEITDSRLRSARNLLATMLLSLGVPMIAHGDELLRSQGGNNNPYCLDDATTWVDWSLRQKNAGWFGWVRAVIALRQKLVPPRRALHLAGHAEGSDVPDVLWFGADGRTLDAPTWSAPQERALGVLMAGARGLDDAVVWLCNPDAEPREFVLPELVQGTPLWCAIDTVSECVPFDREQIARAKVTVAGRAMVVLAGEGVA
ncbi:MAG: glycogen debranching protein GlgX [Polyangiales bacterium]